MNIFPVVVFSSFCQILKKSVKEMVYERKRGGHRAFKGRNNKLFNSAIVGLYTKQLDYEPRFLLRDS